MRDGYALRSGGPLRSGGRYPSPPPVDPGGYAESMLDLAANPDFAEAFLGDRLTDIAIRAWGHFLAEVGGQPGRCRHVRRHRDAGPPPHFAGHVPAVVKPRHARHHRRHQGPHQGQGSISTPTAPSSICIPDLIDIGRGYSQSRPGLGQGDGRYGRTEATLRPRAGPSGVAPAIRSASSRSGTLQEIRRRRDGSSPTWHQAAGHASSPIHNLQDDVSGEKALMLYRTALEQGRYPVGGPLKQVGFPRVLFLALLRSIAL